MHNKGLEAGKGRLVVRGALVARPRVLESDALHADELGAGRAACGQPLAMRRGRGRAARCVSIRCCRICMWGAKEEKQTRGKWTWDGRRRRGWIPYPEIARRSLKFPDMS